jgi:hypothetical protein
LSSVREKLSLILTFVLVALSVTGTGCAARRRAHREAAYQADLRSYSEALKPGMTRKSVEDYLRERNINFRYPSSFFYQTDIVREPTADTDVVKIGNEPPPHFFCSDTGIYIGLVFAATDKRSSLTADDSDVLNQVILFRWAQCKGFDVLFDEPTKSKS